MQDRDDRLSPIDPPSALRTFYVVVNSGLWALAAALVLWVCLNAPALFDARRSADLARADEIAADIRAYCEKWGLPAGTTRHAACIRDLAEFRERVLRDAAERDGLI